MILKNDSKSNVAAGYIVYDSDCYDITVTYHIDQTLQDITISTKKYLYPNLICELSETGCDISMQYDIIIRDIEKRRQCFETGYNYVKQFIENELKPFIMQLRKNH